MVLHADKRIFLLLHNPEARQSEAALEPVRARYIAAGCTAGFEPCETLPELALGITRLRQKAHAMVVCGGDGSMSSAAPALIESGLLLGIIPADTANDLVRTSGIPNDFEAAAAVILPAHAEPIANGMVSGHAIAAPARFRVSSRAVTFFHRKAAARPDCILFANQSVGTTYLPLKPRNADHATFSRVEQIGLDNCGFDDCGFVRKLWETRVPFISQNCVKGV